MLLLVIIAITTLVLLAMTIPISSIANKTGTTTSIRTMYSDSTTATICLNSSRSAQTPELNGAVVNLGVPDINGTKWSVSWTISSSEWQGSVQKLGTKELSAIIIDQDNDRRMGPSDRIQVRRDIAGASHSLEMILALKFATGQQANCSFSFTQSNGSNTLVSFIDVGQGDSVLIKTADSHTILIDAGPPLAAISLVSYMHNRSISVIDALIITHPDADHLGGAADVLQSFTVLSVYHPGAAKNTATYRSFMTAAQNEHCPIHTANDTHVGDYLGLTASATIEVLNIDPTVSDVNDASIVLEMRTPGKSFLFSGDIGSDVESRLIANHSFDLNVDILKVAHHGSKTSTSNAFLDATTPDIGVISVGMNTYGHPTNDTLARLYAHDVTVLRTDQLGTIDITA
jgi:competence protein ComEC